MLEWITCKETDGGHLKSIGGLAPVKKKKTVRHGRGHAVREKGKSASTFRRWPAESGDWMRETQIRRELDSGSAGIQS